MPANANALQVHSTNFRMELPSIFKNLNAQSQELVRNIRFHLDAYNVFIDVINNNARLRFTLPDTLTDTQNMDAIQARVQEEIDKIVNG